MLLICFSVAALFAQKNSFQISFGSGGGIAGITTTYSLNSADRIIYKSLTTDNKKVEVVKLKKKDVKEIGKQIEAADFANKNIATPGNMSSFINVSLGGRDYKTTWSAGSSGNPALDGLYKKLTSFINAK